MTKGWHGDTLRHSLAARGISTKGMRKQLTSRFHIAKFKSLNKKDPVNEWIADVDLKGGGKIAIADIQQGTYDESYLDFDGRDPQELIGFVHYHPSNVYPVFSIADYYLAVQLDDLRLKSNLEKTDGYTLMGLITDDKVKIFLLKPSKDTKAVLKKMASAKMNPSKELKEVAKLKVDLKKSGELIVLKEAKL